MATLSGERFPQTSQWPAIHHSGWADRFYLGCGKHHRCVASFARPMPPNKGMDCTPALLVMLSSHQMKQYVQPTTCRTCLAAIHTGTPPAVWGAPCGTITAAVSSQGHGLTRRQTMEPRASTCSDTPLFPFGHDCFTPPTAHRICMNCARLCNATLDRERHSALRNRCDSIQDNDDTCK